MPDYKAIFDAIESTLLKVGSRKVPGDEIRTYLDGFKHLEGKSFSDDEYYRILVHIVFYSGMKAQTVTAKLPVIDEHFPNFRSVARYGHEEVRKILSDSPQRMIRNRNKIRACVENAKTFTHIVLDHGSFQNYIDSFGATKSDDNLFRLKEELQDRFSGLGGITVYHFLTDIGMPVAKPDRVVSHIFARLGLVERNPKPDSVVHEARKFAQATGHPVRYIDIVVASYGHVQHTEVGLERGICTEANPSCSICGATKYCSYYAQPW